MSWNNEDYLRNETESNNYETEIEAFLRGTEYTTWFEERQAEFYNATLAKGIEQTLMASHEDQRERARFALRQLAKLAEEAREEAAVFVEDGSVPPGVPGHTCPAIDGAQRVMRQLAWRLSNPDRATKRDTQALVAEGLELLEQVRNENKQMRAAHADIEKELKAVRKQLMSSMLQTTHAGGSISGGVQ